MPRKYHMNPSVVAGIGTFLNLPSVFLLPAFQPCYLLQHLKVHKLGPVMKSHQTLMQMSKYYKDDYYAVDSNLWAGFCSRVHCRVKFPDRTLHVHVYAKE